MAAIVIRQPIRNIEVVRSQQFELEDLRATATPTVQTVTNLRIDGGCPRLGQECSPSCLGRNVCFKSTQTGAYRKVNEDFMSDCCK